MTPARILIVEDERIIALTLQRMLEDRGYEVVGTATSAQSAVQKAKSISPDIVLMDIHLSGPSDGIAAARQIEADSALPIVFLTAYSEDETIRRASQCNPYSYLVKPVQSAELHATIQVAMAKHAVDRRLRLALDASSTAVWEWNIASDQVETLGDVASMLGKDHPAPSSVGSLFSGVHPDDKQDFEAFLARSRATESGERFNVCFRYCWEDRTIRWIESHARVYRNFQAASAFTIGTLRDVTTQRESDVRLRLAAALFENLADAVVITDPDRRITAFNPAFAAITGCSPEILDFEIQSFLDVPEMGGSPWRGESRCRLNNGHAIPIWLTVTPVTSGDTLSALLFSFSDISPLRRAQSELEFLAHHDPLTGLPNRLRLSGYVDERIARAEPFSLIYVDLDHFKAVNDFRGHTAGDAVLRAIAARIRSFAGDAELVARLGGDEFIVVCPGDAADLAASLVSAVSKPLAIGGESLIITASVGSSAFPTDGESRDALLLAADTAMYVAKREGPNSYRPYSAAFSQSGHERYQMEQEIHRAFAVAELQLLYQPIVSLADGRITGAEALVRWRHPERGLLNPDRFVPIVEDAGLIEQLGEAVVQMACSDWTAWLGAGSEPPRLSLNVSARQMTRGDFPAFLSAALQNCGLAPNFIEIEITESSLQSAKTSQRFIAGLKNIGVKVAIDDFGTGYSHLAALRDLPVDRLKLDRAFLPGAPAQRNDFKLLSSIVSIARAMNLLITAEGIETTAHLELVRSAGCDEAQGFWFSHPVSFADLISLHRQGPFPFEGGARTPPM